MVADLTQPKRDNFDTLAIIISVLSISSVCESLPCEGFFKGCCPGSSWNTTSQQCEKCMPGYNGINCSSLCPYPTYGVECQTTCNCSRELCDVSTGCIDLFTDNDIKRSHQNSSLAEEINNSPVQKNSTVTEPQQSRNVRADHKFDEFTADCKVCCSWFVCYACEYEEKGTRNSQK